MRRLYALLFAALLVIPSVLVAEARPASVWHVPLAHGDREGLLPLPGRLQLSAQAAASTNPAFTREGSYRSRPWGIAAAPAAVLVRSRLKTPAGTAVQFHVRIQSGGRWQPWQSAAPDRRLALERPAQALQVRVVMLSSNAASPVVDGVEVALQGTLPLKSRAAQPATFRIYATREGLVGGRTANGHVIKPRDRFVALPSWRVLNRRGEHDYQVRVSYGGRSVVLPVWDIGPWNTRDDYWSPDREMWRDLPLGLPQAQAAYQNGHNGGRDQFGRRPALPNGIDIADGAFWDDLGLRDNSWVEVTFLWLEAPTPDETPTPTPIPAEPVPPAPAEPTPTEAPLPPNPAVPETPPPADQAPPGPVPPDAVPPTVQLSGALKLSGARYFVRWTGQDDTSGVAGYDVQVRFGDGLWTSWLENVAATQGVFTDQAARPTATFRVRARDRAGNVSEFSAPFMAGGL
jgi:hypothetical protein